MSTIVTTVHRFDEIETRLTEAPSRELCFRDPDFCDALKHRLDAELKGRDVLSLDVFDTLILRDNSSEVTRFFEIGGRMAQIVSADTGRDVSQVDAFLARHLGTKATYRASKMVEGVREGSLNEIHAISSRILTGSDKYATAFVKAELDYEATRIAPNPFLVEYVRAHRDAGGKVALVTDMYMHAEHVADLLELLGIAPTDYDLLISSADTKLSKASGGIFALVEAKLDRDSDSFLHLGDSHKGDVARPFQSGWAALHLPLSTDDVIARRRDHLATAKKLLDQHAITVDIAMPRG